MPGKMMMRKPTYGHGKKTKMKGKNYSINSAHLLTARNLMN